MPMKKHTAMIYTSNTIVILLCPQVYGWGDCRYGQLGIGREYGQVVAQPQRVQTVTEAQCVDVVCGNYHSVSLMDDGT